VFLGEQTRLKKKYKAKKLILKNFLPNKKYDHENLCGIGKREGQEVLGMLITLALIT
jgi:hypothetical protein